MEVWKILNQFWNMQSKNNYAVLLVVISNQFVKIEKYYPQACLQTWIGEVREWIINYTDSTG
jgi:hypothetical protein